MALELLPVQAELMLLSEKGCERAGNSSAAQIFACMCVWLMSITVLTGVCHVQPWKLILTREE